MERLWHIFKPIKTWLSICIDKAGRWELWSEKQPRYEISIVILKELQRFICDLAEAVGRTIGGNAQKSCYESKSQKAKKYENPTTVKHAGDNIMLFLTTRYREIC